MGKIKIPKVKISELRLIGERIILRPLKISDAKDIYTNIQDRKIAENTLRIPWPYRLKDAINFIKNSQKSLKKRKGFIFGIELKEKKEVVGVISLENIDFEHRHAEVGYWLGKKYRGKGIMTEAGKLVLNFAFEKLKLHRVDAGVFSDNLISQKVLKKLGFKKEGVRRHWRLKFGRWKDDVMYSILENEYYKKVKLKNKT
jgi:ribosomal-protein-alanine N-acetyltransferase